MYGLLRKKGRGKKERIEREREWLRGVKGRKEGRKEMKERRKKRRKESTSTVVSHCFIHLSLSLHIEVLLAS